MVNVCYDAIAQSTSFPSDGIWLRYANQLAPVALGGRGFFIAAAAPAAWRFTAILRASSRVSSPGNN
jgi:hypothetical protein